MQQSASSSSLASLAGSIVEELGLDCPVCLRQMADPVVCCPSGISYLPHLQCRLPPR